MQDRVSVRAGERPELRYLGLESIEPHTGLLVQGDLSKTPQTPEANAFVFSESHVLYGKLRPYLNKVYVPAFSGKCSTELIPLKPSNRIIRDYLAYYLRAPTTTEKISQRVAGARMPRAEMPFVMSLRIPLPSLDEQHHIADLLSHAENIVRMRREADRKAKEIIPALFLDMFGKMPSSDFVCCGDVCEYITKGTTPKSADITDVGIGDGVPFLKVMHITDNGDIDFASKPSFISRSTHQKQLARSVVYPDDVLMNIVGPPLGRIALIPSTFPEWNVNQALAIFRARALVLPYYLFHALRSAIVLPAIMQLPVGVRQLNISLEQCRRIRIPLPAIAMQEKFGERMRGVEAVLRSQTCATRASDQIFDALLARVFGTPS